jgi:CDP-glycerol glycerophosphotransferase
MKLADMMITDYSSIYIDFLLTDRPTLFFLYDYDKYVHEDRDLRSDFERLLTGPILSNQNELEEAICNYFLYGSDQYAEKRKTIRDQSFSHRDGKNAERTYQTCIKP